jgi:MFS transporter, DHA3 family, macrolide efflux protein
MSLFGLRDFRLVWSAAAVSWLGDSLAFLGFMWLAYDVGGAGGVIAVRVADSIPSVIVGLLGGVVADRVERRRLMIGADLLRAAALGIVLSTTLAGVRPTVLALAATMFLIRIGDSFFEPASGAMLPDVVPQASLQRANSVFHATGEAISGLAMGGAGLLLIIVPLGQFFTIDAVSFLLSALLLSFVATRSRGAGGEQHPVHELLAGFRDFSSRPALGIAMVMFGLGVTIGAGVFIPAAPVLVGQTLEAGPGSYGLILLGFGVGAIIVAVVLARVEIVRRELWSILFWVGYPACFLIFAVAPNLAVMVAAAALAGAAESGARILLISAMQHQIGAATLGRAMSVFFPVPRASHGVGLLTVGLLVTALPLDQALAIGAALGLLAMAGSLAALRPYRVASPVGRG